METEALFLKYSAGKLEQLSSRITLCVGELDARSDLVASRSERKCNRESGAASGGNVRQWIWHGVAGEPDTRDRNAEFSAQFGMETENLTRRFTDSVERAILIIRTLPHARLEDRVSVQGHDVSVLEAIYHVVEHFSGHAGQIIFLTKFFTGEDLGFYSYLKQPTAAKSQVP